MTVRNGLPCLACTGWIKLCSRGSSTNIIIRFNTLVIPGVHRNRFGFY
jgi:hypothetical protein